MDGESASLSVDIRKRLGSFLLRPCFSVDQGELIVLFGHSGSGKSLTLRAIAGLLRPDSGRIRIDGRLVFDTARRIDLPPQQRGVGMVVQNYALFPHMSVAENIAFGLHGDSSAARRARLAELAAFLGITELLQRRPGVISGGQAQRVALARALAPRPGLLLLDEPFSALDSAIRVGLRRELARLKRDLALTVVFVTHDLREAYNLADRMAVLDGGEVLQSGTLEEVFNRPSSARVAHLTEVRNIWRGLVVATDATTTTVDTGRFQLRSAGGAWSVGETVDVCIRPERVLLMRPERAPSGAGTDSIISVDLIDEVAHGAASTLYFRVGEAATGAHDVEVDISSHVYEVMGVRGQRRWALAFPHQALHVMPASNAS